MSGYIEKGNIFQSESEKENNGRKYILKKKKRKD